MHTWLIDNIKAVAVWLAQIAYGYMCDLSWRVKNISGHIWQLNFRPKSPIGDQQIKKKKKRRLEKIINLWSNYRTNARFSCLSLVLSRRSVTLRYASTLNER